MKLVFVDFFSMLFFNVGTKKWNAALVVMRYLYMVVPTYTKRCA